MPRVRHNHKLVRIPLPAWAAYQLTLHYPADNDKRLLDLCIPYWLNSNNEFLRGFGQQMIDQPTSKLTMRQRLTMLCNAYPDDKRLINMRKTLAEGKEKFAAEVRKDPVRAYRQEAEAVQLAISKRTGKIKQEDAPW